MTTNFMKSIARIPSRVPYDEQRIVRGLSETGCQYAAACMASDPGQVSDQRLASEYARHLLLGDAMSVRAFCERNRDQMLKQNTKESTHKKAFADVLSTVGDLSERQVGSLTLGGLVSLPRLPTKLVVEGIEFGTPDSFMSSTGLLTVVVFANDLNDGPMGTPFRWWHRLSLEGSMAALAAGLADDREYLLVGVSTGESPSVRAVKQVLYHHHTTMELAAFAAQLKSGSVRACLNSSCKHCSADRSPAIVEEQ